VVDIADPERRVARLEWLVARSHDALDHLRAAGEVRVRVVGDAEMAAAHEEFAGAPGTTDVLTFDLSDPDAPPPVAPDARRLDADILVCADEARRQAASRGHEVERELLLYIIHGVLHCMGHDDHDEAAAAAMHTREDEVLAAIGVGPTYRSAP
jgi:probable rRNA maturation factor